MIRVICASAFALAVGSATAQSIDQLLPENTLFVVSVDDMAAYNKAQESMPFSKMMKDEEVVAFLEKPKAAINEAIAGLQEQLRSQEGFENFDLSLEALTSGSYGRMFFALTHIALPDPQSGVEYPDIGLVIGWEGKDGAPDWQSLIKDAVTRMAGRSGEELSFQAVTRGELTYEELVGGSAKRPPVLLGKAGKLQLVSLSHDSLSAVISRAQGKSGASLAANATYKSAQKNLGVQGSNTMRVYVAVDQGLRAVAEIVKMGLAMDNETEYIPLVDRILDKSGLLGIKSVAVAGESVDGVAHSRSFVGIEGPRTGLLALSPEKPISFDRLNTIPKAVSSFSLAQFDFGKLYDFVFDVIKEVDEDVYNEATQQIAGMGAMIGGDTPIDLRKDILGNMGPEFMYVQPQSSNPMSPAMLLMMETQDGARLMSSIRAVIDFVGTQTGGELSARVSEYKGSEIVQIALPSDVPLPLSPSFTVANGQLIAALNLADLKRHLRFIERGGATITENEDFQRFFGRIPENAALQSISYTDVKGAVEMYYGQAVTMLPMLTMMAETEIPVDFAMMPTSEALTRNLYGSLAYSMSTEAGAVQESFSPFGGEIVGGIAAVAVGGALLFGMQAAHAVPEPSVAPVAAVRAEEGPEDTVRRDLSNLKAGVTIFKLYNDDQYPERLEQLLEPTEHYPDGCLGESELPIDPWGNAYLYKRTDNGYVIWSVGPNGTDEQGAGDDIVKRKG